MRTKPLMSHLFPAFALTAAGAFAGCTGSIGGGDPEPETPAADGTSTMRKPGPGSTPPGPGSTGGPGTTPASSACKDTAKSCVGTGPTRRITRAEYQNTVATVFGAKASVATLLPQDERVHGYAANTAVEIAGPTADRYAGAAAAVAKAAVLDGVVPCPVASGDEACARAFINAVAPRVYRRPVEPAQVDRLLAAFRAGADGATFDAGIRLTIEAMLQSPFFLYHVEAGEGAVNPNGARPLSGPELAARLSYFLWDAPPDAGLVKSATDGTLVTPDGLRAQAKRLVADDRAAPTLVAFVMQWLRIDDLEALQKDEGLFPEFGETLIKSMRAETEATAREVVVANNGGVAELLTANFTYVDDTLAKLYGLPKVNSTTVKRVTLDTSKRLGVLSQASFLAEHAHPAASSTVKRGYLIRERLLCNPPPPPPADAQEKFESDPRLTQRQEFERVLANPACGGCHAKMDPLGFAFENMDALGKWRDEEAPGQRIDASGHVTDSDVDGPFANAVELVKRLTTSKQVGDCVADNWFPFVTGRLDLPNDEHTVKAMRAAYHESGGRVRDFLVEVVMTDAFRFVSAQ